MKPSSRKAKGRVLQNEIRDTLYEYYSELRDGDIRTAIMGESGIDIKLSPTAKDRIPFDIEAKYHQKVKIWEFMKQAEANAGEDRTPLVVFRRNYSETYAVLKFTDLLDLLTENTNKDDILNE